MAGLSGQPRVGGGGENWRKVLGEISEIAM